MLVIKAGRIHVPRCTSLSAENLVNENLFKHSKPLWLPLQVYNDVIAMTTEAVYQRRCTEINEWLVQHDFRHLCVTDWALSPQWKIVQELQSSNVGILFAVLTRSSLAATNRPGSKIETMQSFQFGRAKSQTQKFQVLTIDGEAWSWPHPWL